LTATTGQVVLSGLRPLLGVLAGAGATVGVQRSSARETRQRAAAEARQAQRSELKAAIASFLEAAQHLQTQLYAREHGGDLADIPLMAEDVWLAHAQVDILCSAALREPLVQYADALNAVARHEDRYQDWWSYVIPHKSAFIDAVRAELKWPESLARRNRSLN
jgi:cellobiose-specific phosphotransferase system component IIA